MQFNFSRRMEANPHNPAFSPSAGGFLRRDYSPVYENTGPIIEDGKQWIRRR
jgi:hypothetical protein